MQFHLNHIPKKISLKIEPQTKIVMLGSCFSEHVGSNLKNSGFNVNSNPFGVIFNPLSIFKIIDTVINEKEVEPTSYLNRDGLWYNYNTHSTIFGETKENLEKKLKFITKNCYAHLKNSTVLFITFGSAFYYTTNKMVVANCHKQPQTIFSKQLVDTEHNFEEINNILFSLNNFNPNLKIVFTVSPVLHTKDGVEENFLSKSLLRVLIEKLIHSNNNCMYFSSYELVRDDLRDYRFYEKDLVHPNNIAIDYVYNKLKDTFFSSESIAFSKKVESYRSFTKHSPINNSSSPNHINKIEELKQNLHKEYPFLNL